MWPSSYLLCIQCVQEISVAQNKLRQPSLDGARRSKLEKDVKFLEQRIQTYAKNLLDKDREIKKLQNALEQLCKYE